MNSDGKIQLEETINESVINGDANTTANVSDSTFDESKNVTQTSDKTDGSDIEVESTTAAVLSIDDPESGEIYKNHIISNNINNNNHIPSKTDIESVDAKAAADANHTTTTTTATTNNDITADANGNSTNDANGDVVNNDIDNKRLFNNSNTDAANAVG